MSKQEGGIDITKVPLSELNRIKKALGQELNALVTAIKSLKLAQSKYLSSQKAVQAVNPHTEGKKSLIPLTESLYVTATLTNPDKVLVDFGTGYYVEMNQERAIAYYNRKIEYVTTQMKGLQQLATQKEQEQEAVSTVLQQRMAAQEAQA